MWNPRLTRRDSWYVCTGFVKGPRVCEGRSNVICKLRDTPIPISIRDSKAGGHTQGWKRRGKERERERELCTVSTTLVRPSLRCLRVKKIIPERSARWTNVWNGDHDRGESDDAHAFIVIVRNEGNFLGNFGGIFAFDYTDFEICFRVDAN